LFRPSPRLAKKGATSTLKHIFALKVNNMTNAGPACDPTLGTSKNRANKKKAPRRGDGALSWKLFASLGTRQGRASVVGGGQLFFGRARLGKLRQCLRPRAASPYSHKCNCSASGCGPHFAYGEPRRRRGIRAGCARRILAASAVVPSTIPPVNVKQLSVIIR
jgi:hypothetical protein